MELQWPLILFTTFLSWSAGLFATQGFYALKGEASKAQMPAWITSVVLLVIGGISVFLHLEHWERIFNGFGKLNSGITQELIAIVLLAIAAVIFFVYLRKSSEDSPIPKWISVVLIILSAALLIVMAHSYMMPSRPAWNSVFWIVLVLGNACAFGLATMAIICAIKGDVPAKTDHNVLVGTIVNAVAVVIYSIAMEFSSGAFTQVEHHFDPTNPMADVNMIISAFTGEAAAFVWIAIIFGALLPLALCIWRVKFPEKTKLLDSELFGYKLADWRLFGAIIVLLVLLGAVFIRVGFYLMGLSVFMFY